MSPEELYARVNKRAFAAGSPIAFARLLDAWAAEADLLEPGEFQDSAREYIRRAELELRGDTLIYAPGTAKVM